MPSLNATQGDVPSMDIKRGIIDTQINQSVFNGGKDAVIKSPDINASNIFFAGIEFMYENRMKRLYLQC